MLAFLVFEVIAKFELDITSKHITCDGTNILKLTLLLLGIAIYS